MHWPKLRQQLADRQAAFAALFELEGHRHQAARLVLGAELDFRRPLAGELVDRRLGIEQVGPGTARRS